MPHALIIGAGLGGLATALRLAHAGFRVTVLEKQPRAGGRANLIQDQGFRVDTGPTILVMKSAFEETYRAIGQNLDERLDFKRLDPNYRVYYHDDTHLDLYASMPRLAAEIERVRPGATERLFRFLGDGARKYELGMPFIERNYDAITDLVNPSAGLKLLSTRAHRNLYRQVSAFFDGDDKLSKAFSFHAMFLGLSPFEAPAMYSLITYADLALGMYYPMGGIYALVEDMLALAQQMGVDLQTGAAVEEICVSNGKATGVRLAGGRYVPADLVISNADLPYTYRQLLPGSQRTDPAAQRLGRMQYACSGYLLYLGVDRTYPHARHQSLYFSRDYRANLDAIFRQRRVPEEPSFHLNIPTVTDPGLAPPGHSLLYVLAPMPNLQAGIDWAAAAPRLRDGLLDRLEHILDPELREHIVWEREYRPGDFLADYNAAYGTAFGSLSHGFFQSSYFRPHNKAAHIDGLYFVGQGTYPGIGMPMVMISARLVTERVLSEWK